MPARPSVSSTLNRLPPAVSTRPNDTTRRARFSGVLQIVAVSGLFRRDGQPAGTARPVGSGPLAQLSSVDMRSCSFLAALIGRPTVHTIRCSSVSMQQVPCRSQAHDALVSAGPRAAATEPRSMPSCHVRLCAAGRAFRIAGRNRGGTTSRPCESYAHQICIHPARLGQNACQSAATPGRGIILWAKKGALRLRTWVTGNGPQGRWKRYGLCCDCLPLPSATKAVSDSIASPFWAGVDSFPPHRTRAQHSRGSFACRNDDLL